MPSTPAAPSNYVDGPNVNIKWTKPKVNGLEITAYTVTIQTSTGSFLTELTNCDGAKTDIVAATQCEIPLTTLITAPFNLARGDSVNVKILATNAYGSSSYSAVGSGAIIVLVPDAPVNLLDNHTVTLQNQVGLVWQDGTSNGGTAIIDYQIWFDQGTGATPTLLLQEITTRSATVTGLTAGTTYKF